MIAGIGMPWCTPESWTRLCAVADNRAELVDALQEYEEKIGKLACQFEAQGYRVERVMVDVDEMVAWCCRQGYRVNQTDRAAYGAALCASIGSPEGRA
jgi:hypothetical protein